jgi:hypothetical protein
MTKEQIDDVLERVRTWPPGRQEDAARLLLEMEAAGTEPYVLSQAEEADIEESLAEMTRGDVASDYAVLHDVEGFHHDCGNT